MEATLNLRVLSSSPEYPRGWSVMRLRDALSMPLRNGLSPSHSGTVEAKVLTLAAITGGEFDASAWKNSTFASPPGAAQEVDGNDFLICRGNGNLHLVGRGCFPIGRMPHVVFPDTMIAARVMPDLLDRSFLQWVWNSTAVRRQVEALARTTNGTYKLNQTMMEGIAFGAPPLPEQRRIAEVLDRAEALRAKRRAALGSLDTLTQACFLDLFGHPVQGPKHPKGTIRTLVETSSGKSASGVRCENRTGIPIYGGNGINGWATKALFDEPVLVFGRVGQQCGITCLTDGPAWVTDNAIVTRVVQRDRLNLVYLMYAFSMTGFSRVVKHLDLPFINQEMILTFPLPLPPPALQNEFARRVTAVEKLKATHRSSLAEMDALFASLQDRAFRGEL